ncbi:hypothetical protein PC9H_004480 [Pleurotus ostreatus]|uniref:Uncharacterized protein n=1 Tax=Pleurotus ostreatus TaxID=5322 RepID=A0A8H6ZXA6_PLEOS|nr:uncharacterized protein PC9H_004480 [Pleurotus ostreatus]KAF7432539.1 hypothetical protein PC9H_004480 [Pleurotus ostreatus]KAJ8698980.1 hypothetical protein PTI98_005625 [Pleurotus ostreatus]
MRWTHEQRTFLSQYVDAYDATAPNSNESQLAPVYDTWKRQWTLNSDVKTSMKGYFRFARAKKENQKSHKVTKGNPSDIMLASLREYVIYAVPPGSCTRRGQQGGDQQRRE